jgi:hypothetical protein
MREKSPQGGKRQGAGRPKGVKKNVSFWINQKDKQTILKFIKTLDLLKNLEN